jgi:putative transposase
MPRSARILLPDHIYHLTHRCHNGSFFLRFATTRKAYRKRLWQAVRRFNILLLNYCITSNHTHQLVIVTRPIDISAFMRHLEGEFAADYNRRKHRRGAFWSERYHSTVIEDGSHFWNCMHYIDLNMVRAGVVVHPKQWAWCGYQEIAGIRQRYCLINLRRLQQMAPIPDSTDFARWYSAETDQAMARATGCREAHWTESIAVGSEAFVRRVAKRTKGRKRFEIDKSGNGSWYVRESAADFGSLTSDSACSSERLE